jgi:WD40 repeat protein
LESIVESLNDKELIEEVYKKAEESLENNDRIKELSNIVTKNGKNKFEIEYINSIKKLETNINDDGFGLDEDGHLVLLTSNDENDEIDIYSTNGELLKKIEVEDKNISELSANGKFTYEITECYNLQFYKIDKENESLQYDEDIEEQYLYISGAYVFDNASTKFSAEGNYIGAVFEDSIFIFPRDESRGYTWLINCDKYIYDSIDSIFLNDYYFTIANEKGDIDLWDFKDLSDSYYSYDDECGPRKQPSKTFNDHKEEITAITISKDNKYLISASNDKTIKIWNIRNRKCLKTIEENDYVQSIVISSDNKSIFYVTSDNEIKEIKFI